MIGKKLSHPLPSKQWSWTYPGWSYIYLLPSFRTLSTACWSLHPNIAHMVIDTTP